MKEIALFSVLFVLFFSCSKEEAVYPHEQSPYVEFDDLIFIDDDEGLDELEISFIVWDLEGDIGLSNEKDHFRKPYHIYDLIIDVNDLPVKIQGDSEPPFFKAPVIVESLNGQTTYFFFPEEKEFYSEIDNRPLYSCDNYEIVGENSQIDTVLIEPNKYFNNLLVDFLDASGNSYDFKMIFNSQDCSIGDFNARLFPIQNVNFVNLIENEVFKIIRNGKYSWRVSYRMSSQALKLALQKDPFEVTFQVIDRELNESNIATSSLVLLPDITAE